MHAFFRLSIAPRRVLALGIAASVSVLLLGVILVILLSIPRTLQRDIRTDVPLERLIFSFHGNDAKHALQELLSLIYGEQSDDRRIADAVIASLVREMFGDAVTAGSLLHAFGDAPFFIIVQARQDKSPAWVVSLDATDAVFAAQSQLLHNAFESRFPSISIRTRTVPSGKELRDVIANGGSVDRTEERWGAYRVTQSTEKHAGNSFLSAFDGSKMLAGNDRNLLAMVTAKENDLQADEALFVNREGFRLFSSILPDSPVIRYARGILRKDHELSLSSFFCMP